jgi:hypothetical protein
MDLQESQRVMAILGLEFWRDGGNQRAHFQALSTRGSGAMSIQGYTGALQTLS